MRTFDLPRWTCHFNPLRLFGGVRGWLLRYRRPSVVRRPDHRARLEVEGLEDRLPPSQAVLSGAPDQTSRAAVVDVNARSAPMPVQPLSVFGDSAPVTPKPDRPPWRAPTHVSYAAADMADDRPGNQPNGTVFDASLAPDAHDSHDGGGGAGPAPMLPGNEGGTVGPTTGSGGGPSDSAAGAQADPPLMAGNPALNPVLNSLMTSSSGSTATPLAPTAPAAGVSHSAPAATPASRTASTATPQSATASILQKTGTGTSLVVPAAPAATATAAGMQTRAAPAAVSPAATSPSPASGPQQPAPGILVTGADAGSLPQVKVFDASTHQQKLSFLAFDGDFRGGVRVAAADLNGDGVADVIAGAGPGGGSQVRVFDGRTGTPVLGPLGSFQAFAPGRTDGVFVAAGDVNGDGKADVIVGTDAGSTPEIKVFSGTDGSLLADLFPTDLGSGGVRVAAGDVNGDGKADIIAAAGPGEMPRVDVFDAVSHAVVYDFLAFDATFRGGVNLAAADLNGDGKADIIAGAGAGGLPQVAVFNGADTASLSRFQAYDNSFTGGVRVAAADVNGDGTLDVVTAQGSGGGNVRAFDFASGQQLIDFTPYGRTFSNGLFVGASPGNTLLPPDPGPTVTVVATTPDILENSSTPGVFTLSRTGDTSQTLTVSVSIGGSALETTDYTLGGETQGQVVFAVGSATATVTVTPVNDQLFDGTQTVVLSILSIPRIYSVGTPGSGVVAIDDLNGPDPVTPGDSCGCGGSDLVQQAPGVNAGGADNVLAGPVQASDGVVRVRSTNLSSDGFGTSWGQSVSWTNNPGYAASTFGGNNTVTTQQPYLRQDAAGTVVAISNGSTARFFDFNGTVYSPRFYLQEQLTHNAATNQFTLTDTSGQHLLFWDFNTSLPANQRGQLVSLTDAAGNATQVSSWTPGGQPQEVQRSNTSNGVTVVESYLSTYISSGVNAGKVSNVTLRRQVNGGAWTTIRQTVYAYYDGTQSYGNAGDLMTTTVEDANGTALDTTYSRYYTAGQANGYQGGLKYSFGPQSYARLLAAVGTPQTATDAQVAPYADNYFQYDAVQRVSEAVLQGSGDSQTAGGLGTYTYSYTASPFAQGYNSWQNKTVETLPDGNQNIVYTNYAGETMLSVFKNVSSGQSWLTFHKYDSSGRDFLDASPSAVTGYDETRPDLLNNQSGNYQYLSDSTGLVTVTDYYASTTAGETTPGGVAGYVQDVKLQQGELGTGVLQSTTQYFLHSGSSGNTVAPVATQTVYRNADGTGAETTSYAYTWLPGSTQMQSETVTKPIVTAGENGPGTADVRTTFFDVYGRPEWGKDADGFLSYTAYDQATGAVVKSIADVNTADTSDFQNLPAGWTTPPGGGLELVTQDVVDGLGRTTEEISPAGNITYTVYNDPAHEVRTYRGWNTSTNAPTGPTEVTREDRGSSVGYSETLTMTATPHVTNGAPDGSEALSGIQTLARDYTSAGGQVTRSDAYFNLSGVTYSTALYIGVQNSNFYTTLTDYDVRGRQDRVQSPTGTINRTVFDSLGRTFSMWVGTNDTPPSGEWSPSNNGAPSNMIEVSANVYDKGGVGDGNLTQRTQYPGGALPARVEDLWYDWRDRQVVTKQGVQASENDGTHRPIVYQELDNLGEVTATDQYDGDGVTITTTNGVPNQPSASLLRARTVQNYDEQGRDYRTQVYSVDQVTGAVSSTSLNTDTWFDHRGEVIKTDVPGGIVTKTSHDGAGRVTVVYTTDGGGDTTWADASNVVGDAVLNQVETSYDNDGNTILTVNRDRFHDETGTGALGDPSHAPHARVSYAAEYYDLADRLTADVNVGTNGGVAWTRPGTVPAASDTVLVTAYGYGVNGWVETTTDARGLVTKTYHDALGRTTQTVEDYTNGTPTNNSDKTTDFTYDGAGHELTVEALLAGGTYETTQYVYGVTTAGGSYVNSNDVMAATEYPDPTTGNPSTTLKDVYTVDALGETLTQTDRNGNVHSYTRDVLGRQTADAVTTLGAGVDGAVRRIETAYDTGGRAYLFTSYDAALGGNVVNQVQDAFNGLGQLAQEWQAHSGAVNTLTTPSVQYAWNLMAGGANNSRLVSMTYPNGRVLTDNYNAGLDTTISRLSSLSDTLGTLESYAYLGLDTVVERVQPQAGTELTYVQQPGDTSANHDGGDQYTGLDRFGRVSDQFWLNTGTGTALDRVQYGRDRDSNVLFSNNLIDAAFSELYHANGAANGYDGLNQLAAFARGVLSDTNGDGVPDTIASPSHSQSFATDAVGNFSNVTTDGTAQARTQNAQNEITSISGATTPAFDANGNMTTDQAGHTLVYSAWNLLVQAKQGNTVIDTYQVDAEGRRITENPGTQRDLYYSDQWQVLEERVGGVAQVQQVWSPVYIDALVERDRAPLGDGNLTERLYAQQDANWNVTALVNTSGTVVERDAYDPYGVVSYLTASWGAQSGSSVAWVYGFQGQRTEVSTGLNYVRHRDYDPTLMRWGEVDPITFGSGDVNFYRAFSNSPTHFTDPSGLQDLRSHFPPPRYARGLKVAIITDNTTGNDDRYTWIWPEDHTVWVPNWRGVWRALSHRSYDKGSISCLVLSGHGAGGGVATKDGTNLKGSNLPEYVARMIRLKLAPNGVIVIASCGQGKLKYRDEILELARKTQRAVYVSPGDVYSNGPGEIKGGGYAEKGWIRVDPPAP